MTSFSQLLPSLFSDNSNIMLAAIISLLLVILFVLLLHLYAKWFLAHAHAQAQSRRRRRRRPVTVSDVLSPSRFHHFHSFNLQDSPVSPSSPSKGLDSAAIAAIPVFVYEEAEEEGDDEEEPELECVICLSAFGDGEIGRSLPKCAHAFHVDCIDMWLASHSNCPICRAPIVSGIVETHHSHSHSHSLSQLGSVLGDDSSAVLEIVIDSPTSENTTESERGSESLGTNSDSGGVSDSAVPMSETSSSLLRSSLKRMLSKVFPSKLNQ